MKPINPTASRGLRPLRVVASVLAVACVTGATPTDSRAIEHEESFYQLGVAVGRSLTEFRLSEEELAVVQKGMIATIQGEAVSDPTEAQMKRLSEIRNARVAKITTDYLDKTKKEKGAEPQPSGLIYFEIEAGSGQSPVSTDDVEVHYHGTLSNGAVFDSSVKRGTPAQFPLDRVIACWTEGVGMMKVGGKARLVCPPGIAYGDRGAPPTIPGGAVLNFEVELIKIVAPTELLMEEE